MSTKPTKKLVWIGIDQSLRCSGIFWVGDGLLGWKKIETKKLRGTERLIYIRDTILKIIEDLAPYKIQRIAMEGYSFGSHGRATFSLGELGGVLKISLTPICPNVILQIPPMSLKKYATGNGNAEKADIITAANEVLNLQLTDKDTDIADAAFLALIAQQFDYENVKLRHQLEVIKTIRELHI